MIPGRMLHRIAARICSAKSLERVIEPAIADLQKEYQDAIGSAWRRRWRLFAGYLAVCQVLALCLSQRSDGRTDEVRVLRALSISGAAMIGITVLLLIPPVIGRVEFVRPTTLWLLVPQAVPLAIPLGLVVGLAYALNRRVLSAAAQKIVLAAALLCSIASFVTLIWAMPAANQEFRQRIFTSIGQRGTVMKGLNEMSLSELNDEIAFAKVRGNEQHARRVAWYYHLKSALAAASFVLALFAVTVNARSNMIRRIVVLVSPIAYWLLLWLGESFGIRTSTPAVISAWLPNIVLVASAAIMAASRGPSTSTDHRLST
jgi:lipopolysaccharide export LptBFGC system permease protein LptF